MPLGGRRRHKSGMAIRVSGSLCCAPDASGQLRLGSDLYIHYVTMTVSSFRGSTGTIPAYSISSVTSSPPGEVEEVFAGDYKVRRTRRMLYIALGETLDGRLAFVVFRRLPRGAIRVVTARDMEDSERRLFRRK